MDFSEEWKSQFPICKVFRSPLLLSSHSSRSILGPLFFNPKPQTLTQLFSSPSLSPPLLLPPPQISLSRFLCTSSSDSSLPFSASSTIASQFGPQNYRDHAALLLSQNRLQLLQCPDENGVVMFFSTGCNHDQIGFLLLSVKNSNLVVQGNEDGDVFKSKNRFNHRIIKILVTPVANCSGLLGKSSITIGYLLACSLYSVHWFSVSFSEISGRPVLGYLGFKLFKTCSVVAACWSPHLPEESVVLLESGALFLFDLESCLRSKKSNVYFKGTRLRVSWDDSDDSQNCKWVSCEFSWHPRVLIVARSDAVFLVDLRCDECKVSCLAKIEMLGLYAPIEKEHFLAFSRAGSDGFHFVLVSDSLLVLCDVRKPLMPILQWAHGLDKPCYIDVFRLSELRTRSRDNTYDWATESGFCILVGSFWNCEFGLFCYGPSLPGQSGSLASEISKFCKSLYAWELPSDLLLSGHECRCGSCILKGEFLKDALPEWIDWQQKKEIVLGFCILNKDLSVRLAESDELGGFTLIRLMSSGKLESQRFYASWDLVNKLEVAHRDSLLHIENNLLYSMGDEEYKFPKRYKYLKLDYLYGYLEGNLSEILDSKMKKPCKNSQQKESFSLDFHEILCEKLKVCGYSRFRSSPAISVVFDDISLPTSICEVALRRIWADLPMELLQLAFSSYYEFLEVLLDKKKVSLEFLVVPELPQLPPFFSRKPSCRSSKWSHKVQRSDALVGPVLPLPILLTLHEFRNGCPNSQELGGFSSEVELSLRCNEVMQVAREVSVSDSSFEVQDDRAVSLDDDRDDMWVDSQKPKPFFIYHPVAFDCSTVGYKDERFAALISKVQEKEHVPNDKLNTVGLEMFDDLCPIKLKFDTRVMSFGSEELKAYNVLKRQFSKWQEGFIPYQEFCSQTKFQRQDA